MLPESSIKELNEAKVLAVGPGMLDKKGNRLPMSVASGDKVLIPQVCGIHEQSDDILGNQGWDADMDVAVRRKPNQGWRRGVLAFPGP